MFLSTLLNKINLPIGLGGGVAGDIWFIITDGFSTIGCKLNLRRCSFFNLNASSMPPNVN